MDNADNCICFPEPLYWHSGLFLDMKTTFFNIAIFNTVWAYLRVAACHKISSIIPNGASHCFFMSCQNSYSVYYLSQINIYSMLLVPRLSACWVLCENQLHFWHRFSIFVLFMRTLEYARMVFKNLFEFVTSFSVTKTMSDLILFW